VNTNLREFQLIVPCGIADHGVTSLERVAGREVSLADAEDHVVTHFAAVFDANLRLIP
jgi:lipoyl(octanoyl) transferase